MNPIAAIAPNAFFRTVFGKLILCFLAAMLALFLFMQIVFSTYGRHIDSVSAQAVAAECMRLGNTLTAQLQALRSVQQNWLLDEALCSRLQNEEPLSTSLIYQMYFQAHRRASLLFNTSSINGLYLYIAYADYLLPVVSPYNAFYQTRETVHTFLKTYEPSAKLELIACGNRLLFVNAYARQRLTFQSPYQMAIVTIFSDQVFAGTAEEASWMRADDGHIYTYGDSMHDTEMLRQLSLMIDGGAEHVTLDSGDKYAVASVSIGALGMPLYYMQRLDASVLQTIRSSFVIALLCIVLALVAVFLWMSRRLIQNPLRELRHALNALDRGDYTVRLTNYRSSSDFARIGDSFNRMVATLEQLIERDYRQRLQLHDAKFHLLQSQINPHFLYNSLFQMNSLLALQDYDTLEQMLLNLGEYFQYIFKSSSGTVRLSDELHYAKSYAFIQQVRFIDRVRITIQALPSGWADAPIPCMTLQPILENAFQHGFGKTVQSGAMTVSFAETDANTLCIRVENTGAPLTDEAIAQLTAQLAGREAQGHSALANIQHRLVLLLGASSGLTVSNLGGTGFGVCFHVHRKEDETHAV